MNFFNLESVSSEALTIAALGYSIVFSALVILYFLFSRLPRILELISRFQRWRADLPARKAQPVPDLLQALSGEEGAALAAALHLYFQDQHDQEDPILTISKISRTYSPWSSKIYGVWQSGLKR